ncbi:plastocyanin/azurin family copper-binding protein [Leadbetterella sp. DM7]|uniref:plastocyanin/azurin family copper-binding protein n=1 Tax=Leadbetterella sp. DM7 TaxID=3235085 RepID=UPI00349EBFC9
MKKTIALAAVTSMLIFTACSKSSDSSDTTTTANATEESADDAAASEDATATEETDNVASADNTVLEITLKGGDDMKYDQTTLKATAGQTIKLTLVHSGKLPKASMGHNFVLLKNGVNETDFATKALAAKDTDYIPASAAGDIIAHTDLVGGGESSTIEFTAPARGAYTYICTFPGHSAMMKGKLLVQ